MKRCVYLVISVNYPVHLKIIVVLTKRVDELLSNLKIKSKPGVKHG